MTRTDLTQDLDVAQERIEADADETASVALEDPKPARKLTAYRVFDAVEVYEDGTVAKLDAALPNGRIINAVNDVKAIEAADHIVNDEGIDTVSPVSRVAIPVRSFKVRTAATETKTVRRWT